MQTAKRFGHDLSIRGEIEGFTWLKSARSGRASGRRHYWIAAPRGDKAGWRYSNFRGLEQWPPPRRSCTLWWIRVDSGAGAHRLLFRGHVHRCRELADAGASSENRDKF
jgi:hypothetical protein